MPNKRHSSKPNAHMFGGIGVVEADATVTKIANAIVVCVGFARLGYMP